eukprot:gene13629-biopygen3976
MGPRQLPEQSSFRGPRRFCTFPHFVWLRGPLEPGAIPDYPGLSSDLQMLGVPLFQHLRALPDALQPLASQQHMRVCMGVTQPCHLRVLTERRKALHDRVRTCVTMKSLSPVHRILVACVLDPRPSGMRAPPRAAEQALPAVT